MKAFRFHTLLTLAVVLVSLPAAAQDDFELDGEEKKPKYREEGPTKTDEVAAKLVALAQRAMGGNEAMGRIESMMLEGRIETGKNKHAAVCYWLDGMYREEVSYRHMAKDYLEIRAASTEGAWTWNLKPEEEKPRDIGKNEALPFQMMHANRFPFLDWEENGYHFAYRGEAKVRGIPCYLIVGTLKEDFVHWFFIDKETFVIRRIGFRDVFRNIPVDVYVDYMRLETINGVRIPTILEYSNSGDIYRREVFDRVDVNVPVERKLFFKPVYKSTRTLTFGG